MQLPTLPIALASSLPRWRRPEAFLILTAAAMPMAFATWNALLNNFVVEVAQFDGSDIGWLHTVREIPGFLAVGVILLLFVIREQVLAVMALVLLGASTAVTAWFPSFGGILMVTLLSSIGFHYYETVNQSLQLQWLPKDRAPQVLGMLVSVGSGVSLAAYGLLALTWERLGLSYNLVFLVSGGICVALALAALAVFPQFEAPERQHRRMILRRRYWLYYVLQFLAGARRQIFVVFAAFMMVERFGFQVDDVTALFLINYLANMALGPVFGRFVGHFGERNALVFEYAGLTLVFLAYGGIYWFGWGVWVAAALYVIDHLFFSLAFALKTYLQKIADPADIAPTSAVAFTINHIAAVFLPAALGYLWLISPASVYGLAAAFALVSMGLAALIPRHPGPGAETILGRGRAAARPAE